MLPRMRPWLSAAAEFVIACPTLPTDIHRQHITTWLRAQHLSQIRRRLVLIFCAAITHVLQPEPAGLRGANVSRERFRCR
jgi:hypothetical protein